MQENIMYNKAPYLFDYDNVKIESAEGFSLK